MLPLRRPLILPVLLSLGASLAAQSLPHEFRPNTPASAQEVNDNFAAVHGQAVAAQAEASLARSAIEALEGNVEQLLGSIGLPSGDGPISFAAGGVFSLTDEGASLEIATPGGNPGITARTPTGTRADVSLVGERIALNPLAGFEEFRFLAPPNTGQAGNPPENTLVIRGENSGAVLVLEADTNNGGFTSQGSGENEHARIEFRQDGSLTRVDAGFLDANTFFIQSKTDETPIRIDSRAQGPRSSGVSTSKAASPRAGEPSRSTIRSIRRTSTSTTRSSSHLT